MSSRLDGAPKYREPIENPSTYGSKDTAHRVADDTDRNTMLTDCSMSSATSGLLLREAANMSSSILSFASKFINATGSNADNIAIRACASTSSEDSPAKRNPTTSHGALDPLNLCGRELPSEVRFERLDILLSR